MQPGSVADDRKVGIGHGNLAAMLLREETKCFAFLAGHESFARPFRMQRNGSLRTLSAFAAILIAPSAAAKDS